MSTTEDTLAREALIITFLRGYPNLASSIGKATISAYLAAVDRYSVTALQGALDRYRANEVAGHDKRFVPNAIELADVVRMFDTAERYQRKRAAGIGHRDDVISIPIGSDPPPGYVPLGPLQVDFGSGRIDMRGMDHATKEHVLTHKRLPAVDTGKRLAVTPKLQRMA